MTKICVGIDIAKLSFVAAIEIESKSYIQSFDNTEDGFNNLNKWLKCYSVDRGHFCMESTGKYGDALANFLYEHKHIVSIVNPAKISYFMKSQSARNKTDGVDATFICLYCKLFNPLAWHPLSLNTQMLQALVKRIDTLSKMILQEQNRLEKVAGSIEQSINEHITYLKKERNKLEIKVAEHINQDESMKKNSELLRSIPGIGEKTSSKTIAFLGDKVNNFDKAKQMAAFIGLTPQQAQSGTSLNYTRLSKIGDAELRKMFYMPALVAIQRDPNIKAFYEKLVNKGKAKKVAICAVMRKLVHIIYGVLKSQKYFDPALLCCS